ncbi:hypothetical protein, partial [Xanthomonas phaseoli]|uniref:hypothetical protein n=2 Tax=Xanthomonas phaseoli TaxID=1985254 RepID=UPI001FD61BAF
RGSERGHRDRYGLPHPPIALFRPSLKEEGKQLRQFHVLRNWHYLGSATSLAAARKLKTAPGDFDRDCYRILRKGLQTHLHNVVLL